MRKERRGVVLGRVAVIAAAGIVVLGVAARAGAAEAYIVVDNTTGHILDASNADRKLQVASLTKVATALVVLDMAQLGKLDLAQRAVVPPVVRRVGAPSPVGLQEGDAMSVRDLLYCALLGSDNVAAMALAHHAGARLPNPEGLSPVGNFVAHMNALARELGMKRTLFLNPTGEDAAVDRTPPHSTAADMARLARYAYSEAAFPFYVSQRDRTVHVFRGGADMPATVKNTNELLDRDGIDGVKTGTTARAGQCLILSSEQAPEVARDGTTTYVTQRRIAVVLLGSRDRFGEGLALVRRGWSLYGEWARRGRPTKRSNSL